MKRQLTCYLGAALLLGGAARAVYEPAPLPDPSRRWAISATVRGEYDDNFFTDDVNKWDTFKAIAEPQLLVNVPLEQTFFGLRYRYGAVYYPEVAGEQFDQSHIADLLFSHTFTPRWSIDLRDSLRFGQEPEMVDVGAGIPVTVRRRGDFLYNTLSGKMNYNLSRRWTASIKGGWNHWSYDDPVVADQNDRKIYQGTLSAVYALDPRTLVGGNYQFTRTDYANPALPPADPNARNSDGHTFYISAVRRFNPKLSVQVDAGGQFWMYDDGHDTLAPFVDGAVSYTYAPESLVSGGFRYMLTATELATYRDAESAVLFGRVKHRFTPKLYLDGDVMFALNTFTAVLGSVGSADETVLRLGIRLTYKFVRWCEGEFSYIFDHSDSDIPGYQFDRNRVSLGLRLIY